MVWPAPLASPEQTFEVHLTDTDLEERFNSVSQAGQSLAILHNYASVFFGGRQGCIRLECDHFRTTKILHW